MHLWRRLILALLFLLCLGTGASWTTVPVWAEAVTPQPFTTTSFALATLESNLASQPFDIDAKGIYYLHAYLKIRRKGVRHDTYLKSMHPNAN